MEKEMCAGERMMEMMAAMVMTTRVPVRVVATMICLWFHFLG